MITSGHLLYSSDNFWSLSQNSDYFWSPLAQEWLHHVTSRTVVITSGHHHLLMIASGHPHKVVITFDHLSHSSDYFWSPLAQ